MSVSVLFQVLSQLVGGLGLFLLGMKYMSEGMQAVAGSRLRKMIGTVTNNRVLACGTGTLITCLIQSSSVCSVMAIGLVNGGFMSLTQAIGVIIGSNIGTTFTGWILVLKIGRYGLPLLGLAAFVFLFTKKNRTRYIALAVLGIGMVFFGMETMKSGFDLPVVNETLKEIFATLSGGNYLGIIKAALFGCLATVIVQSSSATLGVTLALAQTGVIDYQAAAGLVLGFNIGTTVTALLASIASSNDGKRAAYAHVIFNVIGTLWILPFYPAYMNLIEGVMQGSPIGAKIAFTHTTFNVLNTIVFLPLLGYLAKIVRYLAPDKKEIHRLQYLDIRMVNSPALGIVQSKDQIKEMGDSVQGMLDRLKVVSKNSEGDGKLESKIFHREEILDGMQKEIFLFLSRLVAGEVSQDVSREAHSQIRMADEYESLSDYISNVLEGHLKMRENNLELLEVERGALLDLHERVATYIRKINQAVKTSDVGVAKWAAAEGTAITQLMSKYRQEHLERLAQEKVDPLQSLTYTDMLNSYRRMKDHAKNIAQVVAGEK